MNSMSRGYYEPCGKEKIRVEEKQCQAIIKCGCPSSATIPTATPAGTDFTLASLTLDTSCICDPNIKLEFASNAVLAGFIGTLSIRVFVQCRNQFAPVPIGPTWTLSTGAATTDARTFSFFICDSDSCERDCCTYTVVATVVGAATTGTISINNATLGAVVACRDSCKECKKGYYR